MYFFFFFTLKDFILSGLVEGGFITGSLKTVFERFEFIQLKLQKKQTRRLSCHVETFYRQKR
jgi:hypothetical protein